MKTADLTDSKMRPRRIIVDLLMASPEKELSAKQAIDACALFGIQASSCRVALTRLLNDGLLAAQRRGSYVLGQNALQLAGEIATWRNVDHSLRPWQGEYLTIYCQHLGRTDRAALQRRERAFELLGCRELQKGLYIRPHNSTHSIENIMQRLHHLGVETSAVGCIAHDFDRHVVQQIATLWDSHALNRQYHKLNAQLNDWMAQAAQLPADQAARESFLLGGQAIHAMVFDPLLPDCMIDVQARSDFFATVRRFDQLGQAIWQQRRQPPRQRHHIAQIAPSESEFLLPSE